MSKVKLQFGLHAAIPHDAVTAWGARLIFPDDLVWDRQDFAGLDTPEGQRLKQWLNQGGALRQALKQAGKLAATFAWRPDSDDQRVLYEDATGKIVGNPNRSFGYLYVAAFLKPLEEK
jgi:hypothetical protein